MGLLTTGDARLFRGWFKEMAKLRGIHVLYRYPKTIDPTIHAEMLTELSEALEMDIIFDTNPKTSTLKKIHWVSELPDDKPYVAMLPYDAPNLCTECVISIKPIDSLNDVYRDFKITSINTLLEFPDCWTCTLAPIVETKKDTPKNDYSDSNYNYIDEKRTTNPEEYEYIRPKGTNNGN